jgi:hypothetical protein
MPSDPKGIHIEITDECRGKAKRGRRRAPARAPCPPDELCAELGELETNVARTRVPQFVAKRFGGDQRSPDSAKLKTLAPPMTRWSMTLTSISAKQSRIRFVIISSAWL